MWSLSPEKYCEVLLEEIEIIPWIIDEKYISILKNAAIQIDHMKREFSNKSNLNNKFRIIEFLLKNATSESQLNDVDLNICLKSFGLKSLGFLSGAFINKNEFDERQKKACLMLISEKFFSRPFTSRGSSRHALLNGLQLKGIGRNSLFIGDEDFVHSWGGLTIRDGLKAMISSKILDLKTELGAQKVYGLLSIKNENFLSQCILIREATSFRLTQIEPSTLNKYEVNCLKQHLLSYFNNCTPQHMLVRIVKNYLNAFADGFFHSSPSPENLLINGQWIDTESIDFSFDYTPAPFYISFFIKDNQPNCDKSYLQQNLNDFLEQFSDHQLYLYDSWVNSLWVMIKLTIIRYNYIWDADYEQHVKDFFVFQVLNNDKLDKKFIGLIDLHTFFSEKYLNLEMSNITDWIFKHNIECNIFCTDQYYLESKKGFVYKFSIDGKNTSNNLQILAKKIEAIIYPSVENSNDFLENNKILDNYIKLAFR